MDIFAILSRWVHVAASSLLVGVFAFPVLVGRPAAQAAGPEAAHGFAAFETRLMSLGLWALGLTLASGVLDLWREVAVATDTGLRESLTLPAALAVLGRTRYGTVWLIRHALLALLALLCVWRDAEEDPADWLALRLEGLALGATSLALVGAAGHAATAGSSAAVAVDAIHLLATGCWLGALLPLVLFLRWTAALRGPAATRAAAAATRRFSTLGIGCVLVLVLTGLLNAWEQAASVPALLGTPYGRWLLLKLGLFLLLLPAAALNLAVVRPRLDRAARSDGDPSSDRLVHRLRRQALVELACGAAILGVVAVLGLTTPARHSSITWPLPFRFAWGATQTLPGVRARVAAGTQLAVLGLLAALLGPILGQRRWGWVAGGGAAGLVVGLGIALPPLAIDANPATYLQSSVPYTAASVARGETLYAIHCVPCHGPAGYGDGPEAGQLRPRPADLTAKHAADHTVGDLFWWLTHGIPASAMPAFADRLAPGARWDVVNFLRTLSAAERARGLGPTASSSASIVAPDFAFTRGVGGGEALRDYRGRAVVLLVLFSLPDSLPRLAQLGEIYERLRAIGAEILAVPQQSVADIHRRLGDRAILFPVVVDGAAEAARTYALFRRDLTPTGQLEEPPVPPHMELLVDRQGYLRARWIPPGAGWADPTRLLAEVERLAREAPRAPAPDEHVH